MTGPEPVARTSPDTDQYRIASRLFLKSLALIYLAAFASLIPQITALAGKAGIFPLSEQLAAFAADDWMGRVSRYPSIFWLDQSDLSLVASTWLGCGFAVLLLLGILKRWALIALFVLYLSLFHAGSIFMNFQWDYLLLESGFLAIFLANGRKTIVWLFRWLLFRLRFLSGLSKLISADPGWIGLTALSTYFETQPLPHAGAWYAHQLPETILAFGVGFTLFVELIVPWFFFLPRRWRMWGAGLTILLQLLILLTSNHNFFNLLTIALCLFMFDDRALGRYLPGSWRENLAQSTLKGTRRSFVPIMLALLVVPTSLAMAADMLVKDRHTAVLRPMIRLIEPFHIVHRYHVFPTVDTERYELLLEATADGVRWAPYPFRYKPQAPETHPALIIPHQPRIEWLMWFVPKGPFFLEWFDRFLTRLLEGSQAVKTQLGPPPFDGAPLIGVRVSIYRYRFTDYATRKATGRWWDTQDLGPFFPLPARMRSTVQE